jgi:hypothetical protein
MSLPRKIQRRLAKLFEFVQVWLTPEQAAQVKAWDQENRKAVDATHKETKK